MPKFHITTRFYLNGVVHLDIVTDQDLAKNIEYNRTFRSGCFYFVDDEYICGGMLKQPFQDEFIANCKQRLAAMKKGSLAEYQRATRRSVFHYL